ncbi:A disintegrin and metalloproteinase with thrombospondin motifs adt-2-like [Ostrea edulis]|uniref:A disintegrin and metalloproteinase with thrombospondin motifs adt-2-like n=1 Tax=Ostrea edulis TaxID=37623 RepID=UPI0024AF4381|nr:A disintegrin and metalloproteinase with thrombospondin motifs adt-2-like [Ostrea edulis]
MRCYTCSYGKKNSDCTKIETCKKDEESCETQVHRDKAEIKKKCKKTKDCKAKCDKKEKECTLCCTGDLCNKNQGYAEFKTWGQWSSCSKQCGGGKRKRSRECSSSDIPCTGDQSEEQDCNLQSCSTSVCVGDCKGLKNGDYQSCSTCKGFVKCSNSRLYNFQCPGTTVWDDKSKRCEWTSTTCKSAPAQMRCFTCSYGKKNSDCTKIETCKKDEEVKCTLTLFYM